MPGFYIFIPMQNTQHAQSSFNHLACDVSGAGATAL